MEKKQQNYTPMSKRTSSDCATGLSDQSGELGCFGYVLLGLSYLIIFVTLPFSLCFTTKVIAEYERAVIFRLGRILRGGARGPGLFFIVPCMDRVRKVDLRTVTFDVPPQEVLTRDSVTVAVDAVVYYRIYNPVVSITNVEDADRSTRLLAATTLRNVLGTKNLSEILSERDIISSTMQTMLDEATDPWGVKVERVEVKDVRLPVQLQRAMAAEAEAAREARAKVIAAEGEWKASRALKEAADVINESPFAVQLRYLQTLSTISAEKNSTIIFPLPVDLITHFMHKGNSKSSNSNNQSGNNRSGTCPVRVQPVPRVQSVEPAESTNIEFQNTDSSAQFAV
ncbi:hypothetical protein EG68_03917 [Paragonimus skrjabini miyazakii]|uniref:Band 7 domain-containing protein n=1 Tax=Paragonimus skrjabini miyazakii TaxID=59628 RepID=A0A8S9YVI3_9TREM|nr:hypothetical protein EG68_03917 [Paragonimus skrjabini miyazakii]